MAQMSSKKRRVLSFFLWCVVAAILAFLIAYLFDLFNFVEEKHFDFDSHDPTNPNQLYDGTILLKSQSFTEYSKIDVDINVRVVSGTQYPVLYAMFPLSQNYPIQNGDFGTRIGGGWFQLDQISPNHYFGHGEILYQDHGNYWFGISDKLVEAQHSEKADNRIAIGVQGSDIPSLSDKIMVSLGLLGLAGTIIKLRTNIFNLLLPSVNNQTQQTDKSKNNNNDSRNVEHRRGKRR